MSIRKARELIREGEYFAEVDVDLIVREDDEWSPYLSLQDTNRLDEVRRALMVGDVARAARLAKVYRLTPVPAA